MAVSKTIVLLAASLALATQLSEGSSGGGNTGQVVNPTVTIVEDPETVGIGETIDVGDYELTVVDAYITDERYEYAEEDVDRLLAVDIEYRNKTDRINGPSYYFTMYGDDRKLEEYRYLENGHSTVSPGRIGLLRVGYVLPEEVEVLELEYLAYDEYYNQKFYIFKFELAE